MLPVKYKVSVGSAHCSAVMDPEKREVSTTRSTGATERSVLTKALVMSASPPTATMRDGARRFSSAMTTDDTLEALGPLHGYRIARRIEQISGNQLAMNQGTLYPALLRLEQRGWIQSRIGTSDNNRRARFYSLTAAGRRQLRRETEDWLRSSSIVNRILLTNE